jgi:hypothetical protein
VIANLIPSRLAMYTALFAGLLLAVFLEAVWQGGGWRRLAAVSVAVAVLVPLLPARLVPAGKVDTPPFFTTAAVRRLPQGSVALVLPGLAGPPLAAATDRGAQPVGHVLRHGRRMALGLHPHGGQLGKQVLGRDPKLFGDLIYPRVAQPDLTSLSSLERDAGWPADPLHIRFRNASTAASAATVSVTFRARWMLRRRTAVSRQASCPHR